MAIIDSVRRLLGDILQIRSRVGSMVASTPLLGALPELDSMAVVNLITGLEQYFGIVVDDDEISADSFETLGSLSAFVERKLG